MHSNTYKSPKLHILACVDNIYTRALKAKHVAYRNLIFLKLITRLKSNYYKITLAYLKDNTTRMTSLYDVNQPFEKFIAQIETAINVAGTRRVPFDPEQVATTPYDLIFSTGYFDDSCQFWNSKSSNDNTLEMFNPLSPTSTKPGKKLSRHCPAEFIPWKMPQ